MSAPLRGPAAMLALLLVVGPVSTQAGVQQAAGVVRILDGQATVVHAERAPTSLKPRDDVFLGDRITTSAQSLVRTFLGTQAVLTMRELSTLTIAAQVGEAAVTLDSGKIAYAVHRALKPPGETHEIRTPNAVVRASDTMFVVEIERRPGRGGVPTTVVVTHVDVLEGSNLSVSWNDRPGFEICAGQGITIAGDVVDPVRPIRANPLSGLVARGDLSVSLSRPGGVQDDYSMLSCRTSTAVSSDWTLLIDRRNGFETWVGTSSQGYVAGDGSYERVTLVACDAVATTLTQQRARVACARSPWTHFRQGGAATYRDRGRFMAAGPLAGRLIVYESGRSGLDWRLIIDRGKGFELWVGQRGYVPVDYSFENVGPGTCEAAAKWLQGQGARVACVRSPRGYLQYRDIQGNVMAEGPFAGEILVP